VLASLLAVPLERRAAFKAKVRHLRNINVPSLPKTGTGPPIAYSFEHALEIYLALLLESVGVAPRVIARLSKSIFAEFQFHANSETARAMGDLHVVIYPADANQSAPFYTALRGLGLMPSIEERAPIYSKMNISACARALAAALEQAANR
jgi:hypothetical protein